MFSKENSMQMAVSTKNIVAYPEKCAKMNCELCATEECLLCKRCIDLDMDMKVQLTNSYREYIDRHDCKRVFPPKFVSSNINKIYVVTGQYSQYILLGSCFL